MRQILIVDDEAGMRHTIREGLSDEGYGLHVAESFKEARRVLESHLIDVIVSDIILPVVSGIDLLDYVKKQHPTAKVILITGAPTIENAAEAVRRGAFDYLTKPVGLDDLARSVRKALLVKELEETKESYERELSVKVLQLENEIRERKEIEQKLRESEEKYRLIVEQQTDLVVKLTPSLKILFASPSFLQKFGRREDDLLGKRFWPRVHPDDVESSQTTWNSARSGLKRGLLEQRLETPEGYRWISWQWHGNQSERGETDSIVATGRDVTERKEHEEVLAFQAMLLGQIEDSITATDLDGNITYYNSNHASHTHFTAENVVGKHVSVFGENPELGALQQEIIQETKDKGHWRGNIANKDAQGNEAVINLRTWLTYDFTGKPNGMVGIGSDVTEEVRMQQERESLREQLLRSQKMEAVGRLAGGVAHDFNNLLTGINGNVSLLMMDMDPASPVYESLAEVLETVQRAGELTLQLLTFSRKNILSPRSLDLNELVDNLKRMLLRVLGEDVKLVTNLSPVENPVSADPGQLEQVLVNLAINSRDAMPRGGTLTISTGRVRVTPQKPISTLPPGDYASVSVADTGEGLSEEVRSHLFEPFFTTKPVGQGSGLGLATVYASVTRHGGAIVAEEGREQGACFTVYLPLDRDETAPRQTRQTKANMPGGTEGILVVEDEDLVRNVATRILRRLGYVVTAVENAEEAIRLCGETNCDYALLITDVIMPGINGCELADIARKHNPAIKVLYTSGYTEDKLSELQDRKDTQGIFLPKPYSPMDLAVRVRELLDRR